MSDSHLKTFLSGLRLARLSFTFKARGGVQLGPDEKKGDIWRGGFGEALRKIACLDRWGAGECRSCERKSECFFDWCFAGGRPHPYALRPALDGKKEYVSGESFGLDMILIGEAAAHAPRFVRVFEELGVIGVGRYRGRYAVVGAEAQDVDVRGLVGLGVEIKTPSPSPSPPRGEGNNFSPPSGEEGNSFSPPLRGGDEGEGGITRDRRSQMMIELLTPLKLKEQEAGLHYKELPFEVFFRLLLKRLVNLCNLYGDRGESDRKGLKDEMQALIDMSQVIKVRPHTEWRDYKRFSSTQGKEMKIGGQIGLVAGSGDFSLFYPYLRLGEIVGVGTHTTSGFGRCKILE